MARLASRVVIAADPGSRYSSARKLSVRATTALPGPQTDYEGDKRCPEKIRALIADLEKAGWLPTGTGKGSHRKFAHPDSQRKIILSGASGADAHHYQEKLVKAAIREVRK